MLGPTRYKGFHRGAKVWGTKSLSNELSSDHQMLLTWESDHILILGGDSLKRNR